MKFFEIIFILLLMIPVAVLMRFLIANLSSEKPKQVGTGTVEEVSVKALRKKRRRKKDAKRQREEAAAAAAAVEQKPQVMPDPDFTPRAPVRQRRSDRVPFAEVLDNPRAKSSARDAGRRISPRRPMTEGSKPGGRLYTEIREVPRPQRGADAKAGLREVPKAQASVRDRASSGSRDKAGDKAQDKPGSRSFSPSGLFSRKTVVLNQEEIREKTREAEREARRSAARTAETRTGGSNTGDRSDKGLSKREKRKSREGSRKRKINRAKRRAKNDE